MPPLQTWFNLSGNPQYPPDDRPSCSRRNWLKALGAMAFGSIPTGCGQLSAGRPERVWGIRGTKPGWLSKPRVAAFDAEDNLYIADLTDRIQVFDRDGKYLRHWTMPALNVDGPSGLTVDRLGRVLVADTHFYRIMIYDLTGRFLQQIGQGVQGYTPGLFGYPTDVVIDTQGQFYVSEYGDNDRIQVFSPEGVWLRQWGGHGYEPGQFMRPRALAIDDKDLLYVADSCNHRIQVFDTTGKLLRMWGERGSNPGQMSYPYDICTGPDKSLYVCEYGNSRVQKFDSEGMSLGLWGGPGRGPGQLNNPWSLAVDSQGAVSVIDSNNHRVQRLRL
ncbi:MAG: NHL repeat-containing protein [Planctomycetota bacterium]